MLTYGNAWVRIGGLYKLFALVPHHPVGVDLSGSLRVQVDHLELPEVCATDGAVLRTYVKDIWDAVIVKVVLAGVTSSITW